MINQFTESLRASIVLQLERLYTPKVTNAHLSRIVMYECINCSATTGFPINKLEIKREESKDNTEKISFCVVVNDCIKVDFSEKKEVAHV